MSNSKSQCKHCGEECGSPRDPGFVDIAMHVMEALNSSCYNVTETPGADGSAVFRIHLKDDHGHDAGLVAVVTYNPKRGTVLVQQAYTTSNVSVIPLRVGSACDTVTLPRVAA